MRLAILVEGLPSDGGGFHQSVTTFEQLCTIVGNAHQICAIATTPEAAEALSSRGWTVLEFRVRQIDKLAALLLRVLNLFWLQSRIRWLSRFERLLEESQVDLILFTSPSPLACALQRTNFVLTVWDACHRDFPEFPEVRDFGEQRARDAYYRCALPAAYAILVDSDELRERLVRNYGLDATRILTMPFSPSPFLREDSSAGYAAVLERHRIEPGYLFYPAQFWAHKNHVRLLEALAALSTTHPDLRVVFCGADRGNLEHVRQTAERLGVGNRTRFLGFVEHSDLYALYRGSAAVVMPTYFGPTNVPPFEAWAMGRPLVYPSHLAAHAGLAAELFDVDNSGDLARAVAATLDPSRKAELVRLGRERLAEFHARRISAEAVLVELLSRFDARRRLWGMPRRQ